jgi:hypothetical protein
MDGCALRLCDQLGAAAAEGRAVDMWRALGTMTMGVRARAAGTEGVAVQVPLPEALAGWSRARAGAQARAAARSASSCPRAPQHSPRLLPALCPRPCPQVVGTTAFGIDLHTMADHTSPHYEEGQRLVGLVKGGRAAAPRAGGLAERPLKRTGRHAKHSKPQRAQR